MTNYFTATDTTQLEKFFFFSQSNGASIATFRRTLSLQAPTDAQQFERFEVRKLTDEALKHANSWTANITSFSRLHRDIQQFTDEFILLSEHLLSTATKPIDTNSLFNFATSKTWNLLQECDRQQKAVISLAKGIYRILPRLVDYFRSNIQLFSEWQNMLITGVIRKSGDGAQRISTTVNFSQNPKLEQALRLVENYQREYALSYAAASNIIGHFTRLKEMAADCTFQALQLRGITRRSRLENRISVLLISLREMQRMTSAASQLFSR